MGSEHKLKYQEFCREHHLPLFFQPWWLDSTCTGRPWDICLSQDGVGRITGVLPYCLDLKFGFQVIRMPLLTPYLGVWFNYPEGQTNPHGRLSFERSVVDELIQQIPKVAYFEQYFLPGFTDWLPFYWQGYCQQTHYTYRLGHTPDINRLFLGLKGNVRNKVRKAGKVVKAEESNDLHTFFRLLELTFQHQGRPAPFSFSFLEKLDAALVKRSSRKIYLAKDEAGRTHAAIYLAWDHSRMYNLALGADPELRQSGAAPFLLWRGIRDAMHAGLAFDFEGSMLAGVEPLFRSFGATQTPYFSIFKARNKLFELAATLLKKRL